MKDIKENIKTTAIKAEHEKEYLERKINKLERENNDNIKCFNTAIKLIDSAESIITELENENNENIKWLNIALKLIDSAEGVITELEKENNELKTNDNVQLKKIIEFKKEIEKLTKTEFVHKEILRKEHSDWHIESGLAWRINPITLKPEKYIVPKNFNPDYIKDFDFDYDMQMCTFKHPDDDDEYRDYNIPCSLYSSLGGKIFLNNTGKANSLNLTQFKTIEDIDKYIFSKGESIRGIYREKVLQFILEYKNKGFTLKEFNDFCGFKNRESSRQYLKKLITLNIIRRVSQGLYEFNIY